MTSPKQLTDLMRSVSREEIALVDRAYRFAENAHKDHARYSGDPFFTHVFETAKTLAELGMDAKTVAAGLLHDIIEDTDTDEKILEREFGNDIVELIKGVSKLGTLKYRGLKRHTESLRKLFVAIARDIRVLMIKLADRLHNMQTLEYVPEHKRKRIAEETLEIYAPLAYRLGVRSLNRELEDLAFPYVYPEKYNLVRTLLKQKSKETEQHLEKVHRTLRKALAEEGIKNVRTESRLKGLYSLYCKLQRKNMDVEKVYDISALRIIVRGVSDCYRVLGMVHGLWRPLPGRIKDYIAFPKPNGYQGLHTTIFSGDGGIVEIQIRTEEMHRNAEYGIASHIVYKHGIDRRALLSYLNWLTGFIPYFGRGESAENRTEDRRKEAAAPEWLKELAEAQKDVSEPEEFLRNLRADFFKHRVFVFTPKGDVVDLPAGASPIDFAYAIHSGIGNHMSGAKVNGKLVSLNTELSNGDIVEILSRPSKKPTAKWLEFAKTDAAKRKIKAALQKE